MVLKIEGYPLLFGVAPIESYIRIGDTDPDLLIGDSWQIGGIRKQNDSQQRALISLKDGTTTSINTQLLQDRGGSSSISQLDVALIDQNQLITELVTPGKVFSDLMMRKASVYLGFQGTSYPEDFVRIFKGPITDITAGPGLIVLTIAHPDQKKRQQIFQTGTAKLNGAILSTDHTLTLSDTAHFLVPPTDTSLKTYVRIDDEVIEYTGIAGNTLTGLVRAQLGGSIAVSHDDQTDVSTIYRLSGSMIDLALKLQLSGVNGPFVTDVPVTNFTVDSDGVSHPQKVFFKGLNVFDEYGLTVGDLVSIAGATNAGNNFTNRVITSVKVLDDGGSYILVSGAALTGELNSAALCSFQSQYDTLGTGLQMTPDEVDVTEYQRLSDLVGAGVPNYDFFMRDEINGKDFIEQELLYPAAFYAIPRKSKSSLGATLPPISVDQVKILDSRNVIKPSSIKVKRSVSRNYYNTIVYKYDALALDGRFVGGTITQDEDSKTRIAYGNKVLLIESNGLRTSGDANLIATLSSQRLLDRYKYAAEFFEGVQVHYREGFNIEVGDIVVFGDPTLQITDSKSGTRAFAPRAFEVVNVKNDIKGKITLDLTDTGFSIRGRFGVVGPSSLLTAGSTSSVLEITESFGRAFPETEPEKWEPYVGLTVLVHNDDWTHSAEATFTGFDPGNPYHMILSPPLPFTPGAGYTIEQPHYGNSTDPNVPENALWKVLHVYLSPQVAVASGSSTTSFDVSGGDIAKFFLNAIVRVHTETYAADSGEVKVVDITGNTITVDKPMGFTPDNTYLVDYIGFSNDSGDPYRYTQ